ncbi:hypothetical protein KR032_004535 [Drosophila birchii]|nr:hypothetical protein KR032_004535 [Drosophila birchii]
MRQLSGICNTALGQLQQHTTHPPEKVIPSDFEQIGTRFFYISRFARKNWFAARDTCRQIGGELATIHNDEELTAIGSHLKLDRYWIDMNDLVANGKYVSWNTGKPASYFKWHPNQSEEKLNNEHCVDLFQGEMYYDTCFKKNLFICQAN